MTEPGESSRGPDRLPREPADRFTKSLARFLRIESLGGALLLLATIVAVVLSNSPWARAFSSAWDLPLGVRFGSSQFARPTREWINDCLMTLFFFVVALELKRELVLGEMRSARRAAFSIAGALGGMFVPASLYLLVTGQEGEHGWGTVMATDTAFVIGCLALLGRRIPQSLRVFMLSLAIVDDIGAIVVVAIGYSGEISWWALGTGALGLICVRGMALVGIRSVVLYILVGMACWAVVDMSGLHPTITGVCLGLLTPTGVWVSAKRLRTILDRAVRAPSGDSRIDVTEVHASWRMRGTAIRESLSPVERLEMALQPWVSLAIMPLFALANAGVVLSVADFTSPVILAVVVGLTIGKPIGVVSFAWVAVRLRLASRPADLTWTMLAGGGFLAGIGFTMSLFIADLAFSAATIASAKLGILTASVISAMVGLAVLLWSVRASRPRDSG